MKNTRIIILSVLSVHRSLKLLVPNKEYLRDLCKHIADLIYVNVNGDRVYKFDVEEQLSSLVKEQLVSIGNDIRLTSAGVEVYKPKRSLLTKRIVTVIFNFINNEHIESADSKTSLDIPSIIEAYEILGLEHPSTTHEVERRAKILRRDNHPDKNGNSTESNSKFRSVNKAREVCLQYIRQNQLENLLTEEEKDSFREENQGFLYEIYSKFSSKEASNAVEKTDIFLAKRKGIFYNKLNQDSRIRPGLYFYNYKITNMKTGQYYCGQTERPDKRFQEHLDASSDPWHPQYKSNLYCDMRT